MSFWTSSATAYLLLCVDDIILTCSSDDLKTCVIILLSYEFVMKDLSPLSYFLGIFVFRTKDSMFLCQRIYAMEILAHAEISSFKSAATPVDTKSKLNASTGKPLADHTLYHFTFTRPDISYVVQQHQRTKHVEMDIHFVLEKVALGHIRVLHVPSSSQFVDIFPIGLH
ncbi:uncharacterized mitochondrial protein AtMg00810-like [Beta vulgaris subsp. vulgaris]|uniref:uncharacterized mitochondrial protein AtMg00810-like n=1 Tax=Beta vulgaris subsp. vulgaris TaxID=3555 RepID=UPI0009013C48|nr:uncharacterized mitochondrial protein AtMg00810-like [Beta vulgaris subsp. vulgaris]